MADNVQQADQKKQRISLVDTYRKIVSQVSEDHILYFQITVAVLIGLFILYYLTRRLARSVSGRSVLLVGGCESGKTALLYALTKGNVPLTVTSFKENIGTYDTSKKSVPLVDVPGHERVRNSAFARHRNDARALIFMLDSATLHTAVRDVAEQLFSVLSDPVVQGSRCPVAVVCNKQDQELAKAAPVIERALQKEIDVLRETSTSRLASIGGDGSSTNNNVLGKTGQPFAFSHLSTNRVTFFETAVTEPKSLAKLTDWLEQVA